MHLPIEMVIVHSYIKLPEGNGNSAKTRLVESVLLNGRGAPQNSDNWLLKRHLHNYINSVVVYQSDVGVPSNDTFKGNFAGNNVFWCFTRLLDCKARV